MSQTLAAQYTPNFQNYSLSDYNAGNQNWGVSIAKNGKLYVANNNGLLEFDGLKWRFMELPNKTTIRSVLAYKNQVFTGSYEEFGFWEKNSKGELLYTSLSDSIEQKESSNEEFWQILPFKETMIFRSFSNLYTYKEGKVSRVKPKSTVISCNIVNDELYVSTLHDGVFTLEEGILIKSIISPLLISNDIVATAIVNFNNKLMMTTALKGCFIYSNNELTPWKSEINKIIKEHQLNTFSTLSNGNMVFGTIKNGVYITNNSGEIIFHINKENGLINNTILSQCIAADTKLWLGTDNGLASIELSSHHSFYNDISGKLGAVYDVILYKNTIYIGSITGLYFLDKNNKLQFIEGSQGQVWDLKEINGELFCGHNNGTYLVQNNKLNKISDITGGWVIKKVPEKENLFIQGTYTGLVRFKKNNGIWETKHLAEVIMPIKYLVFEDRYTAWAAHAYKGLYKIKFDENYENITIKDYQNKGLWSSFNVRVNKIKNDICFKTNNGWQKYEPLLDSIIPNTLLNKSFGKGSYIISEYDANELIIKNSKDVINFKSLADNTDDLALTSKFFQNKLIVGIERISKFNDSIYALNLNDGFMIIDKKNSLENNALEKPIIERIKIDKDLIDINESNSFEFPYNKNISISVSSAKSNGHYFEYSISNLDSIRWTKMDNEKLEVPSLNNGNYTILFRAANTLGEVSQVETLKVSVSPPWYKGKAGALLYTIIILLVGLLIYYLHKHKINKEQKALQLKFEKEQEEIIKEKTLENDKKIIELKNEVLKNEVKLKSKQLANTAMALAKKNESILEIKRELIQNKKSFNSPSHSSYKKLLKSIDNSIGHADEWEVFEYNFNQVHEEFFKQLKTQFPELTHKDLKICAYIKMNLLSKEIAPLMSISVRGVETHRYRLKRKLNLENDKSLTNYLEKYK